MNEDVVRVTLRKDLKIHIISFNQLVRNYQFLISDYPSRAPGEYMLNNLRRLLMELDRYCYEMDKTTDVNLIFDIYKPKYMSGVKLYKKEYNRIKDKFDISHLIPKGGD